MQRPAGPRDRTQAFTSIFGRPPHIPVAIDHDNGSLGIDFSTTPAPPLQPQHPLPPLPPGAAPAAPRLAYPSRPYPLQLDTAIASGAAAAPARTRSSLSLSLSASPASSSHQIPEHPPPHPASITSGSSSASSSTPPAAASSSALVTAADSRRSSESTRTAPVLHGHPRADRLAQDRSMSMSAASPPALRTPAGLHPGHSHSHHYNHSVGHGTHYTHGHPPNSHGHHSHAQQAYGQAHGHGYTTSAASAPPSPRAPPGTRRLPPIYPALLSRVALAFRQNVPLGDRVKDGLTYTDAFDGRDAVDRLAALIKTTDRNLALLLGRALDAQKFFHDVTYDHRLRDSPNEVYQFRTGVRSPFNSGDVATVRAGEDNDDDDDDDDDRSRGGPATSTPPSLAHNSSTDEPDPEADSSSLSQPSSRSHAHAGVGATHHHKSAPALPPAASGADEPPLPSGVFTLLTDCYSPTCSRDQVCYSIACPRRLEQQARASLREGAAGGASSTSSHTAVGAGSNGGTSVASSTLGGSSGASAAAAGPGTAARELRRQVSRESLGDLVEPGTLWVHTVSKEIADSVSDQEKKRQEAINEVIYTERDFVRDMEYLRDAWVQPLRDSDILPPARRTDFLEQVFWNIHDIIDVATRLRDALQRRQKARPVVERIGDVLLDAAPRLGPFVSYGAHQLYGKYEFEKEKSQNAAFAQFVEHTERLPESRKLELNGYLTKPTTRLARYPLLLEAVLKHTPAGHPDREALPRAVALVREFLARVNVETGRAENRFNLLQLDQQLTWRPGEKVDLRLREEGRELIYKGALNKRGGAGQGDAGDLLVYLFDHAVLMVKQKSKNEQYKVYRRPIPLELLLISAPDEYADTHGGTLRGTNGGLGANGAPAGARHRALAKKNSFSSRGPAGTALALPARADGAVGKSAGHALTFVHLGRKHYSLTLWAGTYVGQRKWVEHVVRQQEVLRERSMVFDTVTVSEGFFVGPANKVNCAAPFHGGRRLVYGTDDGVYLSDLRDVSRPPVKVLALQDVSQVDLLEDYQLLIVLSEKQVITFPLDALDAHDPLAGLKRAKRISSHTSFFKAGVCLGKTLVCVVKSSPLSSTIKALEPIDQNVRKRSKPTFKKLLQGGNDTLELFREFYIPVESSSIHFLKTRLCIGCSKGFEIVDLESLDTQGLLDPADDSLDFVRKRENLLRPMAIFRIGSEFLLCYDEFAFYVNKNGWRSRKEFMIFWEGCPTGFALHYPYVLAFEPTFIEIRNVETGLMSQVIQGNNLRLLFADTPPSTTNTAQPTYYNPNYSGFGFGYQSPNQSPHPASYAQQQHNPYGGQLPPAAYDSRQSLYSAHNGYAAQPQLQAQAPLYPGPVPVPAAYARGPAHGAGRDEIILVSDDRVLALRLVAGQTGKQQAGDNASVRSMPR